MPRVWYIQCNEHILSYLPHHAVPAAQVGGQYRLRQRYTATCGSGLWSSEWTSPSCQVNHSPSPGAHNTHGTRSQCHLPLPALAPEAALALGRWDAWGWKTHRRDRGNTQPDAEPTLSTTAIRGRGFPVGLLCTKHLTKVRYLLFKTLGVPVQGSLRETQVGPFIPWLPGEGLKSCPNPHSLALSIRFLRLEKKDGQIHRISTWGPHLQGSASRWHQQSLGT